MTLESGPGVPVGTAAPDVLAVRTMLRIIGLVMDNYAVEVAS